MVEKLDVDKIDEKMQKNGWKFLGPILHYPKAYKNQASIYEKDGKYVISGMDYTGKKELFEKISKKEAEKKVNESIKEIRKFMILNSK
jgi:hypothetical protein